MRARDLGIPFGDHQPGAMNAITDVPGVLVGYTTLIEGAEIRTGVTVLVPPQLPVYAGAHRLNGNGEMTGLEWVREAGLVTSPIAITNTHSVGVVRDALIAEANPDLWYLPVVAETYDGRLNDVNGMHVTREHVASALRNARSDAVPEGNVGGGTGMVCHGFKGGTGTASRVLARDEGAYTVGVLVQANHGTRERLIVAGVPVGKYIGPDRVALPAMPPMRGNDKQPSVGSIIGIVATDAPLLPHQCTRLAQRCGLGVARTGGAGENGSGDLLLAFSTGNEGLETAEREITIRALSNHYMDALFYATIEATEEAIVNALIAAETMSGRDGNVAYAIPLDYLAELFENERFASSSGSASRQNNG